MTAHPVDDLPFVDEHRILTPAPVPAVWRALARQLAGSRQRGTVALARLLAATPHARSGTPLDQGATLPGFAVTAAVPGRLVRLTGRHRFSRYALVFTLVGRPDGTLVSARTYAEFPGPHGRLYRLLVIGSGGHRAVVRRMLRDIRRRAERDSPA
ncbi:hypothetical protein Q2K19_30500 [Micromonospora soli]|uniref:hypothetical protein n=1 Tax=Micromonospora sp. NBRC 110009 TaxID=3061627 RepID=UPI0026725B19|nr:hypothetical protein [Micromonospora sp. NBRC 110009]WKT98435.1 hypothetical protein Q2K19_30500 [Micromonospora sp. NBRC 110009]